MNIQKVKPQFGVTYDIGWIGFTRTFDFVDNAIAYGERWERTGTIPAVNHVLIVTGSGTCVQAHCRYGVQPGLLSQYLNDPTSRVYFRKPLGWTNELGNRIAAAAFAKVGCKYANGLILEQIAADTILGHFLNVISRGWFHWFFCKLLAKPGEFICSTLGAMAMASQPEFKQSSVLKEPLASIDPQTLFEDEADFDPNANDCSCT